MSQLKISAVDRLEIDFWEIESRPIHCVSIFTPNKLDPYTLRANLLIKKGIYMDMIIPLIIRIPIEYPYKPPAISLPHKFPFCQKHHAQIFDDIYGSTLCTELTSNYSSNFGRINEVQGSLWRPSVSLACILNQLIVFFNEPELPSKSALTDEDVEELRKSIENFHMEIHCFDGKSKFSKFHSYTSPYPEFSKYVRLPKPRYGIPEEIVAEEAPQVENDKKEVIRQTKNQDYQSRVYNKYDEVIVYKKKEKNSGVQEASDEPHNIHVGRVLEEPKTFTPKIQKLYTPKVQNREANDSQKDSEIKEAPKANSSNTQSDLKDEEYTFIPKYQRQYVYISKTKNESVDKDAEQKDSINPNHYTQTSFKENSNSYIPKHQKQIIYTPKAHSGMTIESKSFEPQDLATQNEPSKEEMAQEETRAYIPKYQKQYLYIPKSKIEPNETQENGSEKKDKPNQDKEIISKSSQEESRTYIPKYQKQYIYTPKTQSQAPQASEQIDSTTKIQKNHPEPNKEKQTSYIPKYEKQILYIPKSQSNGPVESLNEPEPKPIQPENQEANLGESKVEAKYIYPTIQKLYIPKAQAETSQESQNATSSYFSKSARFSKPDRYGKTTKVPNLSIDITETKEISGQILSAKYYREPALQVEEVFSLPEIRRFFENESPRRKKHPSEIYESIESPEVTFEDVDELAVENIVCALSGMHYIEASTPLFGYLVRFDFIGDMISPSLIPEMVNFTELPEDLQSDLEFFDSFDEIVSYRSKILGTEYHHFIPIRIPDDRIDDDGHNEEKYFVVLKNSLLRLSDPYAKIRPKFVASNIVEPLLSLFIKFAFKLKNEKPTIKLMQAIASIYHIFHTLSKKHPDVRKYIETEFLKKHAEENCALGSKVEIERLLLLSIISEFDLTNESFNNKLINIVFRSMLKVTKPKKYESSKDYALKIFKKFAVYVILYHELSGFLVNNSTYDDLEVRYGIVNRDRINLFIQRYLEKKQGGNCFNIADRFGRNLNITGLKEDFQNLVRKYYTDNFARAN